MTLGDFITELLEEMVMGEKNIVVIKSNKPPEDRAQAFGSTEDAARVLAWLKRNNVEATLVSSKDFNDLLGKYTVEGEVNGTQTDEGV